MPIQTKQQPPYYTTETTPSIKIYKALITQTATDAPTADIIQNTFPAPLVWSRTGVGAYRATLAGAFTELKTIMPPFGRSSIDLMAIYNTTPADYFWTMQPGINEDYINLTVLDATGSPAELSTATAGGEILIQIEVHP